MISSKLHNRNDVVGEELDNLHFDNDTERLAYNNSIPSCRTKQREEQNAFSSGSVAYL
jgi:hypothetical protein